MRQRYRNATGTGELTGPSGAEPKARVMYTAMYYDEIGRQLAIADYGTNGGSALARPATGDQVTRYVYGTTLADSAVARADLLRAEIYPDSDYTPASLAHGADGVYDRVECRYNRQGEVVEKKDQNETIHAYEYDLLGRRTADRVIMLGAGVEGGVRRIETAYEVRGMVARVTSFDAADGGNSVNDVVFAYDDTGRLAREYQEHAGAKDAATPSAGYAYDPSADAGQFTKGLRPTSLRYPNGRLVHFTYGPPDGTNDTLDRLAAIHDDHQGVPGDTLAAYSYLGLRTIVVEDYVSPQVKLDYTGEGSYRGFDRFGRIVDQRWIAYGQTPEVVVDHYAYQYDRAGNRTRRTNELNHAFDEPYGYDRINRLVSAARADGFAQSWTLDALGNFPQFDDDGNLQTRTANPVNEITAITAGWITPSYDAAGNLTSGPVPGSETTRVHYHYDAWNRLVRVYADDSQNPGAPGDLVAQYAYDGTNRRIEKEVTEAGGGPRHAHYYYNHDWQLLEERFVDQEDELVASNQYVWSVRYIDAPILRFHDGNANGDLLDTEDSIRYYTGDGNFNATATIGAATGGVVERYVYTAYGTTTACDADWTNPTALTSDGPFYCGYFFDAETALYHVRHRSYAPSLSAFVSRDPIGYDGGINLYEYLGTSPLMRTDPSGKAWAIIIGGGVVLIGGAWLYKCDPPGSYDWLTSSERDTLNRLKKEMIDKLSKSASPNAGAIAAAIEDCPIVGKSEKGKSWDGADGTSLTCDGGWACPTKIVLANDFFTRTDNCSQYFTLVKECYRRANLRDFDDTGMSDNRANDDFETIECYLGCQGHVNPTKRPK